MLQLACAVVEALTGDKSRHWEEMASIEKVCSPGELAALGADMHPLFFTCTQLLMLSVNDTESPSVLKQLMDIIRTQLGGGGGSVVTVSDLLGVMVGLYSLVGEDCADEHSEEREAKVRGGGAVMLGRGWLIEAILSLVQEALAELILKHRDCDAEFLAALGIGE